jgi:uncharacterized protein YbcC (UPF0753/DUF2309 family)
MRSEDPIRDCIDEAAEAVGSVWPIHSFVTANPLAGFEDRSFEEAIAHGASLGGGRGYPAPETFETALADGRIDREVLDAELAERGYDADPEVLLEELEATDADAADRDSAAERVDHHLTKWLTAFLDEGRAEWPMPNREAGFFAAFRSLAALDGHIPDDGGIDGLPDEPGAAVRELLAPHPEGEWEAILEAQLTALPGWAGFVKRRADDDGPWQAAAPITLAGFLAARLALCEAFGADIEPAAGDAAEATESEAAEIAAAFLAAWEAGYRTDLVEPVADASESLAAEDDAPGADGTGTHPDAQLVFCIDTRSEVIRRHLEGAGDYETHGYAGFFGVPMEYDGYDAEVPVAACPPILDPEHRVPEVPADREAAARHDRWSAVRDAIEDVAEALKLNPATAFGFVEQTGSGYGAAMAARTLGPRWVHALADRVQAAVPDVPEFGEQLVTHQHTYAGDLPVGLTHEEQVEYAAAAFELMGWDPTSRLVAFVGHASETANNPYDASLDCGACAGNPGGPSARVLAAICNDAGVRAALRDRGIEVGEDTVFVAGQHNTTTDEVELYDAAVPESHADDLARLREDLETARRTATAERAGAPVAGDAGVAATERRAADWAETRPEWGLAGNAGFVIGPRELTSDLDLDGRAFLHSYDWERDPDGEALEDILSGPMVVTQWINSQYYFATVDPAGFGSGSKVTQNPVGNVGVYQGNGGDLQPGLPLQSVRWDADTPYHQPIRLSVVIHAPVQRIESVLSAHDHLRALLDNDWLSLTAVDPTQDHRAFEYESELTWTPLFEDGAAPAAVAEPPRATAD